MQRICIIQKNSTSAPEKCFVILFAYVQILLYLCRRNEKSNGAHMAKCMQSSLYAGLGVWSVVWFCVMRMAGGEGGDCAGGQLGSGGACDI